MLFFHVWVGDAECMLQSSNPNAQKNWPCTLLPSGPPSLCWTSISWCLTSLTSSTRPWQHGYATSICKWPYASSPTRFMNDRPPMPAPSTGLNDAESRVQGSSYATKPGTSTLHATWLSYSFHHQQISPHLGCNKAIHLHHGVAGHLQVVCNLFKCNKICIGIDNSNKSRAYHLLHPLGLQEFHHIWPTFTRFELKLHDHCLITFKLSDIPRTLLGA